MSRYKYRANTNSGNTVFGEKMFLFDKELTKVIAEYNMGDADYIYFIKGNKNITPF